MSRIYVGNLDPRTTERELEDEFRPFGVLRSVWVARKPPGYAFIEFDDRRDAEDAIRALNGKNGWRVELSYNSGGRGPRGGGGGGGGRGRGSSDLKCYECGESGHFARECRSGTAFGGSGRGRRRSPSPRYRRSPSPRYRRSPDYGRSRNHSSPRQSISPHQVSISPRQKQDYSKSPPQHDRHVSPYANGSPVAGDRRRSQS